VSIQTSALALFCGLLSGLSAHAQTWSSGRLIGTSSGDSGSTIDVALSGGSGFNVIPVSHGQFQALSGQLSSTGGGGSTGGGIIPSDSLSSGLRLTSSLSLEAGVEVVRSNVTRLWVRAQGSTQANLVRSLGNLYGFPAERRLRGQAGSTGTLENVSFNVLGTEPVPFMLEATGDLAPLLSTLVVTPLSPGAGIVNGRLLPGEYRLPNINASVSVGTFDGPYRPSLDGTVAVVLGVPAPGSAAMVMLAGLIVLRRRR
jgi:hypothetical protein